MKTGAASVKAKAHTAAAAAQSAKDKTVSIVNRTITVGKQVSSAAAAVKKRLSALTSLIQASASSAAGQAFGFGAQFFPGLGLGLGMLKDFFKLMALCACCAIIFRMTGRLNCNSKRCDCRRWKWVAKLFLKLGVDEYEGFDCMVTVHSVQDVAKSGLLGSKQYKVKVGFYWSQWETTTTKDLRWEQTKSMEVPQGTSDCVIYLYSCGTIKDTLVAQYNLDVKKDMLDREGFFGEKQKLKLVSKGKQVGTILMTFRRKSDPVAEEDSDGEPVPGAISSSMPIAGVDEDSALAIEVMKEVEEFRKTPGFVEPEGRWEGNMKLSVLAKVLTGPLRGVNSKGKETGQVYIRVLNCNFAELKGDEMSAELVRQREKAKKKGLPGLERKWYWAWYEDRKSAEHEKKWHYPEGFLPLSAISSIHRSPERDDQFVMKYSEDKDKQVLIYRRDTGKGTDVWIDGLELAFNECRKAIKEKKLSAEKEAAALKRMQQMHQQWLAQNGPPKDEAQWTAWFNWYKQNNYDDELIRKLYQVVTESAASAPKSSGSQGSK